MNLYEKYRPKDFDEIIGQDKAVKMIKTVIKRGAGGQAFFIAGPSGTGKTTLAKIISGTIADHFFINEYDSADELRKPDFDDINRTMQLGSSGKGGRAFIINEAHSLKPAIIRLFLGLLERIPRHVCFIFTTTKEGQDKLFDDIDAHPFVSRCIFIALTNQGLARPFAEHCKRIAQAENLDGKSINDYIRLAQECKNNCRAMLQAIQTGRMLNLRD
jgi:DNA polymerase III gamma/tau subunit